MQFDDEKDYDNEDITFAAGEDDDSETISWEDLLNSGDNVDLSSLIKNAEKKEPAEEVPHTQPAPDDNSDDIVLSEDDFAPDIDLDAPINLDDNFSDQDLISLDDTPISLDAINLDMEEEKQPEKTEDKPIDIDKKANEYINNMNADDAALQPLTIERIDLQPSSDILRIDGTKPAETKKEEQNIPQVNNDIPITSFDAETQALLGDDFNIDVVNNASNSDANNLDDELLAILKDDAPANSSVKDVDIMHLLGGSSQGESNQQQRAVNEISDNTSVEPQADIQQNPVEQNSENVQNQTSDDELSPSGTSSRANLRPKMEDIEEEFSPEPQSKPNKLPVLIAACLLLVGILTGVFFFLSKSYGFQIAQLTNSIPFLSNGGAVQNPNQNPPEADGYHQECEPDNNGGETCSFVPGPNSEGKYQHLECEPDGKKCSVVEGKGPILNPHDSPPPPGQQSNDMGPNGQGPNGGEQMANNQQNQPMPPAASAPPQLQTQAPSQPQPNPQEEANKKALLDKAAQAKKPAKNKVIVSIPVTGRLNPFVPSHLYGENYPVFSPVPPDLNTDKDKSDEVQALFSILVSGIMYDSVKPSAILSFNGKDFFVQKGDRINNYIVHNIAKDYVSIRNGANIYNAYVGEEFETDEHAEKQVKTKSGNRYYMVYTGDDKVSASDAVSKKKKK